MLQNLPWYGYVILAIAVISYAYKYFKTAKEGYDEADLKKVKFKTSETGTLTGEQLFAIALYTPLAEWWGADTNTLTFLDPKSANRYLKGWYIDTREGYWDLTEYFMKDGRRWYYDFIYKMINTQPEENWEKGMKDYFGNNERAFNYLKVLKSNKVRNELKQNGLITFDDEMDSGIAGYDAAILVGQARKAYTTNIITEEEALKVIKFARELALNHFSSWEEFGKSFIIGFAFDQQHRERSYREEVYHLYKQVSENPESPWNTLSWPNS
ncbi:DUF1266 domain-containing protein [Zhouia spongiae]|uniref:DUF1266 domain-containing protein n=1 Tax=Zhouia spongiae TaxID=2202721 RepID=A0ABY3YLW8_9FLAO|nr:DUF1266 domain-containing protein [Zhouia spongiae]UNY98597.1 DUF1266 domain-containing protein [Zhouia spongiae]